MYAIPCVFLFCYFSLHLRCTQGGLAQLARAFDWQSKGQEFDSPNLHKIIKIPLVYQYIMRGIFILHACLHTSRQGKSYLINHASLTDHTSELAPRIAAF